MLDKKAAERKQKMKEKTESEHISITEPRSALDRFSKAKS